MRSYSMQTHKEGVGDVAVALTDSDEMQYLDLAWTSGVREILRRRLRRSRVFLLVGQARFKSAHA